MCKLLSHVPLFPKMQCITRSNNFSFRVTAVHVIPLYLDDCNIKENTYVGETRGGGLGRRQCYQANEAHCCAKCHETPGCLGFNFHKGITACWLLKFVGDGKQNNAYISGVIERK